MCNWQITLCFNSYRKLNNTYKEKGWKIITMDKASWDKAYWGKAFITKIHCIKMHDNQTNFSILEFSNPYFQQ